eukprot:1361230-Rhodomonas_salina.4
MLPCCCRCYGMSDTETGAAGTEPCGPFDAELPRAPPVSHRPCEIKSESPQSPYSLYQECGRVSLISRWTCPVSAYG